VHPLVNGSEINNILLTLRRARKRKEKFLFVHVSLNMGIVRVIPTFLKMQKERKKKRQMRNKIRTKLETVVNQNIRDEI